MLWILPISTLSIIMFPKYVHLLREERGLDASGGPKRGERVGVKVSGVSNRSNNAGVSSTSLASHGVEDLFASPGVKGSGTSNNFGLSGTSIASHGELFASPAILENSCDEQLPSSIHLEIRD